ncbi:hypothetical protein PMAYCL1PPCAC_18624, partial [Pristionchus mayeri]
QMDATPSSSTAGERELDAAGLARLSAESTPQCILDCRSEGTPIKRATRVSLPAMLLRRLTQGTYALASLNSNLVIPGAAVVIVPEHRGPNAEMSRSLRESLKKYGISPLVFTG